MFIGITLGPPTIRIAMERQQGSVHIVRKFQNLDGSHVFDVTWTASDRQAVVDNPVLRRFSSEQELTEWLKKEMHRDPVEVENLIRRFEQHDRAEIPGLQFRPEELRQFKLAA